MVLTSLLILIIQIIKRLIHSRVSMAIMLYLLAKLKISYFVIIAINFIVVNYLKILKMKISFIKIKEVKVFIMELIIIINFNLHFD